MDKSVRKRICIVTDGVLPVPPSRGGAVQNLVWNLCLENEIAGKMALEVISIGGVTEKAAADRCRSTRFFFVRTPRLVELLDQLVFSIVGRIPWISNPFSFRYCAQRLLYILRCAMIMRREAFDTIVFENKTSLYLTLKMFGNWKDDERQIYYHAHNQLGNTLGCMNMLRQTDGFLCVSDYIGDGVKTRLGVDYSGKVSTLRNGIDVMRFSRRANTNEISGLRARLHLQRTDFVVLFTGRISPEKGVLQLVEAVRLIKDPTVKLVIAGGGFFSVAGTTRYEDSVQAAAQRVNSECERVAFAGYIPYERLHLVYQVADLVALPSLWQEPAMMTALEAMAAGKPLITTATGGTPESVTPECGTLLPVDGALTHNLVDAILTMKGHPETRAIMGENGRRRALEVFGLETFYAKFGDLVGADL
jgi:glycosyltransferase involved in cell wall biosynthesis